VETSPKIPKQVEPIFSKNSSEQFSDQELSQATSQMNVRIDGATKAALRRAGMGNIAAGIRRLAAEFMAKEKAGTDELEDLDQV
jgi:hypothetical protein